MAYNHPRFVETDPISIPKRFTHPEDIAISGFWTAILSWGQRPTILRNATQLTEWMDNSPYRFILEHTRKDREVFRNFIHRTFNGEDAVFFLESLQRIYRQYGSLEKVFADGILQGDGDLGIAIHHFRHVFLGEPKKIRTNKHLADPLRNSSAKRICMFLRWMVRRDSHGVDFGIWKNISPALLFAPLDLHSGATARNLGLLTRKQDDWKSVTELTLNLRKLDATDPVKYDFALYGLGVFEGFNK